MTRLLLIAVVMFGAHAKALAFTAQPCAKITTTYVDAGWALTNGVKEDNWQTQTYFRPPYGARYVVTRGAIVVSQGWLGDGFNPAVPAGCTAPFNVSLASTHTIRVYTDGIVQGNDLVSWNYDRAVRSTTANFTPIAGQFDVQITPVGSDPDDTEQLLDMFYSYVAGSYALYRHAGGEVGNRYFFYLCDCDDSDCSVAGTDFGDCSCAGTPPDGCYVEAGNATNGAYTDENGDTWNVSSMRPEGPNRKFTLIHELGHQIARNVTTGAANGGNCNYNANHPCDSGGHAMWSLENPDCAYDEGFADFYSADVWNSHSQQDCAFKYFLWNEDTQLVWQQRGGPMLDCAADDGPDPLYARDDFSNGQNAHATHPMEPSWVDKCPGFPMANVSTEIDWTRVFWGVHTDGASPPSFTAIVGWLDRCGRPGVATAYFDLDICANSEGGSLNANWNANVPAGGHNIDQ
ncbi:MAG: hypothetical protein A2138_25330 [Deltaproteobacteria bacterium RBG_16_71_12]|nr:MAG: hypothetical protein A2138_25330 [Deltaproteobacteria bacterium RBG_16_71_12]